MHTNKSIPRLFSLRELDSAVRKEVRLDCMGGLVISMVYGFSRPTLPKKKLDASRIVGYGVAAQKPTGRVNSQPVLLKLALMGIAQV